LDDRGSADNTVRLWDVESGREHPPLEGCRDSVVSLSFSPDGKTLATGCWSGAVRLWETATGKELRRMYHHDGVRWVTFSPDGAVLASGSAWTIELWAPAAGKALRRLPGHESVPMHLAFSPDGKLLASGDQETVLLWDVARRRELQRWEVARHPSSHRFANLA